MRNGTSEIKRELICIISDYKQTMSKELEQLFIREFMMRLKVIKIKMNF